jgi:hypothetical protein
VVIRVAKKNAPQKDSAQVAESAVRVLRDIVVDGIKYMCDQVVSFPETVLNGLLANGSVDPHPDAVKHCIEVLEKEMVLHAVEMVVDAVSDAGDAGEEETHS